MLSNCTPTFSPTNPPSKTSPPASSTTTSTPSRKFVPIHWFTYGKEEETQKDKKEKLMEKKNVEDDKKGKRKEWTFEEWMNCKPGEDPFPVLPSKESFTSEELERHHRPEAYAMEVAKYQE